MASKSAKSAIVVLKLAPAKLRTFAPAEPSPKPSEKPTPSSSSTSIPQVNEPTPAVNTPVESNATPAAANGPNTSSSLAPPPAGGKRKSLPAARGTKRGAAHLTADGLPKPRGKPGPKSKKLKTDDPNNKGPFAGPAPVKLGPKANQGAINAGLRALDRTGKPCRKWNKRGFQVRSFTGVIWDVPTWRAPKNAAVFSEDVKSDSTNSSDLNVKDESSAISDKSGLPNGSTPAAPTANGLSVTPAPVTAAS
ncbi:hypothetical protein M011DRAFT_473640 [Sporormia fimetaria CBS 119925]|uniref:DUF1711-domain-containing protein n=1 Tax=Sporormia fimetaria CBS 119925 TaxID=1340428 RepID=A0A6A6VMV0_9PLEO|nr:hypothetical protein M011DRAFT_473640 [Sporormia fimetaria CBS 119925]